MAEDLDGKMRSLVIAVLSTVHVHDVARMHGRLCVWLEELSLDFLLDKLVVAGVVEPEDLLMLSPKELEDMSDMMQLKYMERAHLRRAIQELGPPPKVEV